MKPTVTEPTAAAPAAGRRQAAMPFIMLTVLIDMLSVGLIIPVLPTLVGRFTSSPSDQVFWYGVIAFTYGFANRMLDVACHWRNRIS